MDDDEILARVIATDPNSLCYPHFAAEPDLAQDFYHSHPPYLPALPVHMQPSPSPSALSPICDSSLAPPYSTSLGTDPSQSPRASLSGSQGALAPWGDSDKQESCARAPFDGYLPPSPAESGAPTPPAWHLRSFSSGAVPPSPQWLPSPAAACTPSSSTRHSYPAFDAEAPASVSPLSMGKSKKRNVRKAPYVRPAASGGSTSSPSNRSLSINQYSWMF